MIFRIEECLQELYFDTLKITEGVLRIKLRVVISSWNIERVFRLGKKRGGILVLVRFILLTKNLEVLHANKSGRDKRKNRTRLQCLSMGNTQMTDFIFERLRTTGNTAYL